MWRCIFSGHKWEVISYFNYLDDSYEGIPVPSHSLCMQCARCKKIKRVSNYGVGHYHPKDQKEQ